MDRVPTARFVISRVTTALVAGFITFVTLQTAYPLNLPPSTIQSLAHNGKSIEQASVEFGMLPAIIVTAFLLTPVADCCLAHYQARRMSRIRP